MVASDQARGPAGASARMLPRPFDAMPQPAWLPPPRRFGADSGPRRHRSDRGTVRGWPPCGALVAIEERMVPGESTRHYGRLIDQVRIEVLAAEARSGRVESGIGEFQSGCLGEHSGVCAGYLFRQPEVLCQSDVARHWASRSSSSLSRARSLRARSVKSLSARTLSISASSDSTIKAFKLVPRTCAIASALSASSSGRRTVVCFGMAPCYPLIVLS